MARITVEDCVRVVPNRFELCLIASNRAKSILSGAQTSLDRKEKPAVISLREVAEGLVDVESVRQNITRSIKNRGNVAAGQDPLSGSNEEKVQNQSLDLKDDTFVDENIQIED